MSQPEGHKAPEYGVLMTLDADGIHTSVGELPRETDGPSHRTVWIRSDYKGSPGKPWHEVQGKVNGIMVHLAGPDLIALESETQRVLVVPRQGETIVNKVTRFTSEKNRRNDGMVLEEIERFEIEVKSVPTAEVGNSAVAVVKNP